MIGSEGTLGIITEVTLRLHGIPETISAAVCGFETIEGAVDTVVQSIQLGVPLARVEILDDVQMKAVNLRSELDYPEVTTLFFEFHGSPAGVAEQIENREDAGRGQWRRRVPMVEPARGALEALEGAARGLLRGGRPAPGRGRLGDRRLRADRPARRMHHRDQGRISSRPLSRRRSSAMSATAISTSSSSIDPNSPDEEQAEVERLNRRLVERALAMDGTCTGEHGIGLGKQDWLVEELGDAVEMMRMIKRAIDPQNLFNPGKIFQLA